ncbi:unnamed protein product [Cyprideis torosa]|uniref:Signal recognition particle subunit SRP68 n=1 Tax=Cyprideis torosa TaxID=163714 RepID=A0A7R8ZJZ5_9CRUS|nr:unnamed protein product [Cyprideis torosa]CAG0888244.1 unnamed protein product [Cyprideis torosa]
MTTGEAKEQAAEGEGVGARGKEGDGVKGKEGEVKTFCVPVLRVIKQAQQQHGLRHGDYQRYRGYCSRRVRRVRKALKFVQGDKKHFRKKEVTPDLVTDDRFLLITLMTAERAWSYFMQLKEEANSEPRKRFHMMARLRKAVKYAQMLEMICQETTACDAMTKLEAQAYSAWMAGTLHFELQSWRSSLEELTRAKTIYEKLMDALPEEDREAYQAKLVEIRPSLRFCAYNIGDESAVEDLRAMREQGGEGIDHLIAQTRERQATTLSELTWKGKTIPVRNEKVRMFLLELAEMESHLDKEVDPENRISVLEDLLLKCKDAQQVIRDEAKADPSISRRGVESSSMAAVSGTPSSLQHLSAYLSWIRLSKTSEKVLAMIDSCHSRGKKPQDFIRLYENLLQCHSEILALATNMGDEEDMAQVNARITACKALRTFFIALALNGAKRWAECMAMCQRAQEYARSALPSLKDGDPLKSRIGDLEHKAEAEKLAAHANVVMGGEGAQEEEGDTTTSSEQYLINRLEEWSLQQDTTKLVPLPPPLEPVPCKPLFFDLALNHVTAPSLAEEIEEKQSATPGGISGFVKGLWGWKK